MFGIQVTIPARNRLIEQDIAPKIDQVVKDFDARQKISVRDVHLTDEQDIWDNWDNVGEGIRRGELNSALGIRDLGHWMNHAVFGYFMTAVSDELHSEGHLWYHRDYRTLVRGNFADNLLFKRANLASSQSPWVSLRNTPHKRRVRDFIVDWSH